MENKKETAVEWLEDNLKMILPQSQFNDVLIQNIIQQAKEMGKEQLEKVFKDAFIYGLDWNQKEISFNEYYNETFKND